MAQQDEGASMGILLSIPATVPTCASVPLPGKHSSGLFHPTAMEKEALPKLWSTQVGPGDRKHRNRHCYLISRWASLACHK